jgi:hypothetical protein
MIVVTLVLLCLLVFLSLLECAIRFQLRESQSSHSGQDVSEIDLLFNDNVTDLMATSEQMTSSSRYWREIRLTFRSELINIIDGFRVTSDIPTVSSKSIHMYGGSTILCIEVPDDKTISSYLQREIRATGFPYRVFNRGVSGATVHGNLGYLVDDEICSGDLVIVYFGINDAKVTSYPLCACGLFSLIPLWIPIIRGSKKLLRLRILQWLWYKTVKLNVIELEKYAAKRSSLALETVSEMRRRVEARGASLMVVLQPHIWSKVQTSREMTLGFRVDHNISKVLKVTYEKYLSDFSNMPAFYSFVDVFDHVGTDTFVDWAHANAVGNEIVSKRFMTILNESYLRA